MIESGITLKIEKNNYSEGALDFWIWNPETGCYDPKNAFSDENRLLRFTSESRPLSEYAENELLPVLLLTYQRMKHIRVEYYGSLSDFSVLKKAAESQKDNYACEIEFVPHCDMDPSELRKSLQQEIDEVNRTLSGTAFASAVERIRKKSYKGMNLRKISSIPKNSDAKQLIAKAEIAARKIEEQKELLSAYCEKECSVMAEQCSRDIQGHEDEKQSFSKKLHEQLTSLAVKMLMEEKKGIDKIVNDRILCLTEEFENRDSVFGNDVRSYTEKIALRCYDTITSVIYQRAVSLCKAFQTKAAKLAAKQISDFYGCAPNTIAIGPVKIDQFAIQKNVRRSFSSLKGRYDSGESGLFAKRIKGVTLTGGRKKPYFTVNVENLLKNNFSYNENVGMINETLGNAISSTCESFSSAVDTALENCIDEKEKMLQDSKEEWEENRLTLNNVAKIMDGCAQSLRELIESAKNGAEIVP